MADADFDHAMESAQFNHPERIVPFVATHLRIEDADGNTLHRIEDNHHADIAIVLDEPITTPKLRVVVEQTAGQSPAALLAIRVYG